jgi:hypothetical protein
MLDRLLTDPFFLFNARRKEGPSARPGGVGNPANPPAPGTRHWRELAKRQGEQATEENQKIPKQKF